jgi:hypothetical protein
MIKVKTTDIPEYNCPTCRALLDSVTSFEGKDPKVGDVSVCVKCGSISMFIEGSSLVELTREQINDIRNTDKVVFEHITAMQKNVIKVQGGKQA